jgi:RNA polymerase sigma factor
MRQSQLEIEDIITNPNRIEEFISDQEPFILRSASRASGRYITKSDDEWAVALEGFHKAVQKYDQGRGEFFAFADKVIHNCLVDQFRIDQRHQSETKTDTIEEIAAPKQPGEEILQEIEELNNALAAYGIHFKDLAACSPKAEKTKLACALVIRGLLQHDSWRIEMQSTKRLPIAKIQHKTAIPRKILERHRKYIIAVTEILDGEYLYLAEYVKHIKEGLR